MLVVRPVYHGLALSVGLAVLAVLCCAGPVGAALTEENLVSMARRGRRLDEEDEDDDEEAAKAWAFKVYGIPGLCIMVACIVGCAIHRYFAKKDAALEKDRKAQELANKTLHHSSIGMS
mmetsp:Transcript_2575/g.5670  ORF Transcript_2575/g.5670 Transcript_2575/m.5670 type:complete len:119 (-) Transcript_2575:115-471(-)|eukprot:CAMPEP_0182529180 /NCGR_PEP_ID=MMETSP1323-20130603/4992_1 /TAXON_ID=236787 /ORGANISM="Florenciella parvula, Strain RCC1693" /LENGTH=118 /DNA_ID=CAMNT_0024738369 /DNA_START=125 /DNA_END=481 /DNA_ORIENTATION=-